VNETQRKLLNILYLYSKELGIPKDEWREYARQAIAVLEERKITYSFPKLGKHYIATAVDPQAIVAEFEDGEMKVGNLTLPLNKNYVVGRKAVIEISRNGSTSCYSLSEEEKRRSAISEVQLLVHTLRKNEVVVRNIGKCPIVILTKEELEI